MKRVVSMPNAWLTMPRMEAREVLKSCVYKRYTYLANG